MRTFIILLFFLTSFWLITTLISKWKRKNENQKSDPFTGHNEKQRVILRLAKKNGGKITPIDIALDTAVSVEDAESILKGWVQRGYAEMIITKAGKIIYEIAFLDANNGTEIDQNKFYLL